MLVELKTNSGKLFTILIDGGTGNSYKKEIKVELENYLKYDKQIDLVIITHSDNDHISGMNYILKNEYVVPKIKRIIYNSPYATGKKFGCWTENDLIKTPPPKVITKTNVSNGFRKKTKKLFTEAYIEEHNVNTCAEKANELQQIIYDLDKLEMDLITNNGDSDISENGIYIKFLSPTLGALKEFFSKYETEIDRKKKIKLQMNTGNYKTDYDIPFEKLIESNEMKSLSIYNMASLAFIIYEECSKQSILIMGDSSYEVVMKKLMESKDFNGVLYSEKNPVKLNYFKLSHHGSICDLNKEFFEIIDCKKFLISTDGRNFGHPDKKLIARVYSQIKEAIFYFNYEERRNEIIKGGGIIEQICKYGEEF